MPTDKKKQPQATPGPNRASIDALMKVVKDSQKSAPPKKAPEGESLPDNWGVGDLVRVGKNRLSHAIWGPPKPASEEASKAKKY